MRGRYRSAAFAIASGGVDYHLRAASSCYRRLRQGPAKASTADHRHGHTLAMFDRVAGWQKRPTVIGHPQRRVAAIGRARLQNTYDKGQYHM